MRRLHPCGRSADAGRVVRISVDFDGMPFPAFDKHARGKTAENYRRRIIQRFTQHQLFRLVHIWQDFLDRLLRAAVSPASARTRPRASRNSGDPARPTIRMRRAEIHACSSSRNSGVFASFLKTPPISGAPCPRPISLEWLRDRAVGMSWARRLHRWHMPQSRSGSVCN